MSISGAPQNKDHTMLSVEDLKTVKTQLVDKLINTGMFEQPSDKEFITRPIDHALYIENDSSFYMKCKTDFVISLGFNTIGSRINVLLTNYLTGGKIFPLAIDGKSIPTIVESVFRRIMYTINNLIAYVNKKRELIRYSRMTIDDFNLKE